MCSCTFSLAKFSFDITGRELASSIATAAGLPCRLFHMQSTFSDSMNDESKQNALVVWYALYDGLPTSNAPYIDATAVSFIPYGFVNVWTMGGKKLRHALYNMPATVIIAINLRRTCIHSRWLALPMDLRSVYKSELVYSALLSSAQLLHLFLHLFLNKCTYISHVANITTCV